MALEIKEKVARSLDGTPFEKSELLRLYGGIGNFTYRGTPVQPNRHSTVIIKHAEPYVAENSSFPLDTIRAFYENMMLEAVSRIDFNTASSLTTDHQYVAKVNVTSPEPYAYFPESSTLVLQDFPFSTTLKAYFQKLTNQGNPSLSRFREMGIALGCAIRKLHSWGAATAEEVEGIRKKLQANTMPNRIKHLINYGRLLGTIDRFPGLESSREIFRLVEMKMHAEMVEKGTEETQIIHGDFWTGNILVTEPQANDQENLLELAIIDWEFCQLGHPSHDLAQMLAELHLLVFFSNSSGAKQCMEGLIEGYERGNKRIDADTQYRIAIAVGAHFLGITSRMSDWTERMENGAEAIVHLGAEMITHGWRKEHEWFKFGPLHAVFFPQPSSI